MIQIKVPGKLYIAGEYAVMKPGYPAILVTINRFIYFTIQKSDNIGYLCSDHFKDSNTTWIRNNNKIILDNKYNHYYRYVLAAIKVIEQYALENKINLKYFKLKIKSDLNNEKGIKLGLGSSAAVTVGTIKILNKFYKLKLNLQQIFKLASIAHFYVQGSGSLGDIAAITYEGWIAYYSFDRNIININKYDKINKLINISWPKLKIIKLMPPENLKLLVGWSKKPISTEYLLNKIKIKSLYRYRYFFKQSKYCVENIIKNFKKNKTKYIKKEINYNRYLLKKLSKKTKINIENDQLETLIRISKNNKAAAKTSGAGGGDCGIAVCDKNTNINKLINEWKKNTIEPLNLKVYYGD